MRIVWSVPAQTDLESIYDFIAQENPHAAALVIRRIRDRVRQLEATPRVGRVGRVENTRELVVGRTPYIVAYRIEESRIAIIRIIHGRREWPLRF
ncbi:MAG: type II toxin-antitoxin system RelE/ParE family toxin [Candidatus Odyssella sp.]|nr:type II toxin-antitoxin system RelE/ParE family toxin [Candidatus Odyssella sp.]